MNEKKLLFKFLWRLCVQLTTRINIGSRNGLAPNTWGGTTYVTRPQRVNMCMWFCILGQGEGCKITCVEMSCCCPLGKIFQSERAYSSYASLSHTSRLQYIPSNIIMVWVYLYIINLSRSLWFLHPYFSGLLHWHCNWAVIWLSQCQCSNDTGKTDHYLTVTKHMQLCVYCLECTVLSTCSEFFFFLRNKNAYLIPYLPT